MLDGLSQIVLGHIGEALVKYKLMRKGLFVNNAQHGLPYDLVIMSDPPIKVQVKCTKRPYNNGPSYKFTTSRGCSVKYAYKKKSDTIFALCALDIEKVLFFNHIDSKTKRISTKLFTAEEELRSWRSTLDNMR